MGMALCEIYECRECVALNMPLRARVELLQEIDIVRKSHDLGGRYENLYLTLDALPEMRVILETALAQAERIMTHPREGLRVGWWLNVMRPVDITHVHTHDDDDELLSEVHYVEAPAPFGAIGVEGQRAAQRDRTQGGYVCVLRA
jgi:hypothetical protein